MHDFSHILLVSDYDRTLTGFDAAIPPANLEAIARFTARGGAFTVATGRSRPTFRVPMASGIPVSAPVIVSNGAALWDPAADAMTLLHVLSPEALAAVRALQARFPDLRLELQGPGRHRCFGRDDLRDAYLARYRVEPDYRGWGDLDEPVLVACFYAPFLGPAHMRPQDRIEADERPFQEICRLVAEQWSGLLEAVRSMPRMVELLPAGCTKGAAARQLADRLGRPTLLCAGDAPNDLSMLEAADEAFIPSTSDPAILGYGFTQVCSCDDGAIADIVRLLEARP